MDRVQQVLININLIVGAISILAPFLIGVGIGYFGSSTEGKAGD